MNVDTGAKDFHCMNEKEKVFAILKTIDDPEVGIDIVKMELIRDVVITDDRIVVTTTLTSPQCPYGPKIIADIEAKLQVLKKIIEVNVTHEPAWKPPQEIKAMFGLR